MVDVFDEDLLPGKTQDDDDLLGRVEVELEGELTIDTPIRKWFTLTDLGEESKCNSHFISTSHSARRPRFSHALGNVGWLSSYACIHVRFLTILFPKQGNLPVVQRGLKHRLNWTFRSMEPKNGRRRKRAGCEHGVDLVSV